MKPSRFGPRVVKRRTAAQQEQAAYYKTRPESAVNILPAEFGLPKSSWWATGPCTREEFDARVAEQRPRIVTSRFARLAPGGLAT